MRVRRQDPICLVPPICVILRPSAAHERSRIPVSCGVDAGEAASSQHLIEDSVDMVKRNLHPGARWSIFGHSMGAMVAYEVARLLSREQSRPQLLAVFLSGRRPPGDSPVSRLSSLDDKSLMQAAATWGGIPPEFLAHPHLQPLIAGKLRADLALGEHPDLDLPPLACPIRILSGTNDPLVDISQLPRWCEATTEPVAIHLYDGDHFDFRRVISRVVGVIRETLVAASVERDEIAAIRA